MQTKSQNNKKRDHHKVDDCLDKLVGGDDYGVITEKILVVVTNKMNTVNQLSTKEKAILIYITHMA